MNNKDIKHLLKLGQETLVDNDFNVNIIKAVNERKTQEYVPSFSNEKAIVFSITIGILLMFIILYLKGYTATSEEFLNTIELLIALPVIAVMFLLFSDFFDKIQAIKSIKNG